MRNLLLAIVVLIACFTTAASARPAQPTGAPGAQAPQGPAPAGFYNKLQGIVGKLGLTADQQTKVQAAMQDSKAKSADRKTVIQRVSAVLTADQQKKFHALLEEMRQQNQGH